MNTFREDQNWYVCSLVVQAKPAKLPQVKADILTIPHAEIHGEKAEEGKLVVTLESDHQLALADLIDKLKEINGVIVVSLISNYLDEK
ncbi:reductase [[Haemophilus] ducreyi]|uniref:Chaperone NapD n=2 Tax=Haemophilus ducreyi TaxID=730 RepID=Q7VPJ8_HAEDU|nr:chaperone NapD [[Haemophilus] ducreyi]AAP95083.1 putative napD protein [[Haemophilus] ducreyi 35000HP]AKO30265.1 reductase [[Haemophilus] ducreyi]AKO31698.1 reductase [[Haemophilus] ducreyi]AKO33151.1 reductase [[Haemophilus] ducreyi]AKO34600.1 reductase [[Haemophilus] ducreyi]